MTAYIFPGIGYTVERPLLAGAKILAEERGYRIVEVTYSGFPKNVRGDADKMRECFELALRQAEEQLKGERFDGENTAGNELLFISKSVGTAVAGAFQRNHGIKGAKNIYFTPVAASFQFLAPKSGIVFHGTSDPWADTESIRKGCGRMELPLYVTEGANHSMETGDEHRDAEVLEGIMEECGKYLYEL